MKKLLVIVSVLAILWAAQCWAYTFTGGDTTPEVDVYFEASGTPTTGITSATAGLSISYARAGAASVALTVNDLAAEDTAHPGDANAHIYERGHGWYRLCLPAAVVVAGVDHVLIHGATTADNMVGVTVYVVGYSPSTAYSTHTAANVSSDLLSQVIDGTIDFGEYLRINLATQAGKSDLTGTTRKFYGQDGTTPRVTATVSGGDRTEVTLDGAL
jgi:hypothetical protein